MSISVTTRELQAAGLSRSAAVTFSTRKFETKEKLADAIGQHRSAVQEAVEKKKSIRSLGANAGHKSK